MRRSIITVTIALAALTACGGSGSASNTTAASTDSNAAASSLPVDTSPTPTGSVPVNDIIAANPDKVEQVKAKPTMLGWFVGQVMKSTGGKANPAAVSDLLKAGVKVDAKPEEEQSFLSAFFFSWGPMLLLIGVWIFFMRQMQGGGRGGGGGRGAGLRPCASGVRTGLGHRHREDRFAGPGAGGPCHPPRTHHRE